ncbi:MAG: type II secretion system protein [Candidatus Gastranaerophilales bacterium]|nr:type II secretion system protein [Candidatus Gastranaerophilales bacterium]
MKKMAFTLAEVMITLTIIGVISAIVVPVAIHSRPDENVMKFKKAHNTLYQVINTLVTSDKYYFAGDLGIKADEKRINGGNTHGVCTNSEEVIGDENDFRYFCNTIADLLSTKSVQCSAAGTGELTKDYTIVPVDNPTRDWYSSTEDAKNEFDSYCKSNAESVGAEIVTTDGVVYYQSNPQATFGTMWGRSDRESECSRLFTRTGEESFAENFYKVFCIDVDGIGEGEDPFGYGIRADGKIMNGKRADEWLEKDIQAEN